MFEGNHVLITGGCGYIGSNISRELVRLGCKKVILFDLASPVHQCKPYSDHSSSQADETAALNSRANVMFVKGDICNYECLNKAIKLNNVDSVIHVAGYGLSGNTNMQAHDKRTFRVNVFGTQNVVRSCLENRVRALGNAICNELCSLNLTILV